MQTEEIKVTDQDISKFDPMIHSLIKQEILRYWGNKASVYSTSREVIIGRLGMSFDDLMQYGRMLVYKQIKWFKQYGEDPVTGKPYEAKLTTLMFQYLRNKFMSLSKSFANQSHGGTVINVEETRQKLQDFLNVFSYKYNAKQNRHMLLQAFGKDAIKLKHLARKKTNEEIFQYAYDTLLDLHNTSHVNFEDTHDIALVSKLLSPEGALIVKEEIAKRLDAYCSKHKLESISVEKYVQRCKYTPPTFLGKNQSSVLMKMAKELGIKSQKQLAIKLGIGMSTLSNILHGRSKGTLAFQSKIKELFGKTLGELIVVEDKE